MAARSIVSPSVSFGLVAIPVKLYSATVSAGPLRFDLLHRKHGSRLQQQYVCI
jgi:DNA end-binding protein Ku